MQTRFQFVLWRARLSRLACRSLLVSLAALFLCLGAGYADGPSNAVGRIFGRDISVEDGVRTSDSATSPSGIDLSSGSVVTVHSGKARLSLANGGKVEICGPAKFTVLLSDSSVTLALNFGRVRAELPAKTALRIFTPAIIGTPIDISGASRDVTVGLSLDNSVCVLATSGAIQLEHQFTGEKIIVPQAGEFFLNAGQLLPVAGKPGTCQCDADEPDATPPSMPTETAENMSLTPSNAPVLAAPDLSPRTALQPGSPEPEPALEPAPRIEYEVLQHANQGHPLAASARLSAPAAPAGAGDAASGAASLSSSAGEIASVPALLFSETTALPPPGPAQDTILLLRDARVTTEWEFSGRVEAPDFAVAMEHALGEKPITSSSASGAQPSASALGPATVAKPSASPTPTIAPAAKTSGSASPGPSPAATLAQSSASTAASPGIAQSPVSSKKPKKKGGFWAALKHAFGGS